MATITTDAGGKPSKGTPKDKRLKENKTTASITSDNATTRAGSVPSRPDDPYPDPYPANW